MKSFHNFFFILAVVLIRNLLPRRRHTMFPYGLFSYVARPPTSLVDWSLSISGSHMFLFAEVVTVHYAIAGTFDNYKSDEFFATRPSTAQPTSK